MKNDVYLTVLRTVAGRMCELAETGTEMGAEELTVLTASLQFCLNDAEDAWKFQAELESQNIRLSREVRQNEAIIDQLHRVLARRTLNMATNEATDGAIGPAAGEAAERVEAAETALEAVLAEMGRQMPAGRGA